MEKIVVLPDVHMDTSIPKAYEVVKKFIKDFKPDKVILLGDFMDVSAFSAWDLDKKRLMEGRRWEKEVELANSELDFLQKYSKQIIYLEGNHEDRVERYLDKHPEMEGMIEVPIVLNLKERKIDWYKMNELYKLGHCYFTHGMWINKYHAQAHMARLGCNIMYGHTHRPQSDSMSMQMQKPIRAYGLGCLCDKAAPYLKGRPSNWGTEFAVIYMDKDKHFTRYPVEIFNNKFIFNGVLYQ